MELKKTLNKPYTDKQRSDFIVEYNHNLLLEIIETETALEAWGMTEEEIKQQNENYINSLSMTRGDMFEALILAFGKDKSDIRAMVEALPNLTEVEKKLYLNRFDEALNFYRSYPAVDLIGGMLGITKERMDKFFETKDYKDLLPSY